MAARVVLATVAAVVLAWLGVMERDHRLFIRGAGASTFARADSDLRASGLLNPDSQSDLFRAFRLKYAGRAPAAVSSDPREAMSEATRLAPEGTLVAALTTYTAMLDTRRALLRSRRAWVSDQVA